HAQVDADVAGDLVVVQQQAQRGRVIEAQVTGVGDQLELGGQVGDHAEVVQEQAGVDEVGLALLFAGAQVGDKAVAVDEVDAGIDEAHRLAGEEVEPAAGEVGVVEDGIEAAGGAVGGVVVAAGPDEAGAVAQVVAVVR